MVKYTCLRCGYENVNKSIFIKHLNRRFICKPILKDYDKNYIFNYYFKKSCPVLSHDTPSEPLNEEKKINFVPFCPELSQIRDKNLSNYDSDNICQYCNKKYKQKSHLIRHLKNCRNYINEMNRKELTELKQLVSLLNQQLNKKDKQIDELIKKTGITNNIQNNFKILSYKDTDISHLTKKDFMYCLSRSNMCIPHLIKRIHFNPKKPENHNMYISNIKNNYVMIYEDKKWVIKDRNESINDLIDKNEFILEQKLEEWIEHGGKYPEIMKKFKRYIGKKENDVVLDKIKKEIKLMLFNNRGMITDI